MNLVVPAFPAEDFAVTGDIVFSLGAVKEGEPAAVETLEEFVPGNLFLVPEEKSTRTVSLSGAFLIRAGWPPRSSIQCLILL